MPVVFTIVMIFIYVLMLGLTIFSFVLFVKLSLRGIKALDIYIEKNKISSRDVQFVEAQSSHTNYTNYTNVKDELED